MPNRSEDFIELERFDKNIEVYQSSRTKISLLPVILGSWSLLSGVHYPLGACSQHGRRFWILHNIGGVSRGT